MKWLQALVFAKNLDCDEAVPVAKRATRHKKPQDDADANVLCKQKVRKGMNNDSCDGDCPGGLG